MANWQEATLLDEPKNKWQDAPLFEEEKRPKYEEAELVGPPLSLAQPEAILRHQMPEPPAVEGIKPILDRNEPIPPKFKSAEPMKLNAGKPSDIKLSKPEDWKYFSPIEKFTWSIDNSDINTGIEDGFAKIKYISTRFGKQLANSWARAGEGIISHPLSPIGIRQAEIDKYLPQAWKELEDSGFKGSASEKAILARQRASEIAASVKVPKFQVNPRANATEFLTDVSAGLTGFITQLGLLRWIMPTGTPEPVIWEMQNQATGGAPGEGAAMRMTLGQIGRIPTTKLSGKALKVMLESGLFGGYTYLSGGDLEEVVVSSLIPVAFNTYNFAQQKRYIAKTTDEWYSKIKEVDQRRVSLANRRYDRAVSNAKKLTSLDAQKKALDAALRQKTLDLRNSNQLLESDMRKLGRALDVAKRQIYSDDAFAPAREKWLNERQKAMKMIEKGGKSAEAGRRVLDFLESKQIAPPAVMPKDVVGIPAFEVRLANLEDSIRKAAGIETEKHISTGFTEDPTEEGPAVGEPGFVGIAGRPGGKVKKPWLNLERTKSPDNDIEDFFGRTKRPPYKKKVSGILEKIYVGLRERFEFAMHIPKTKENAIYIDIIRTMPEERRAAIERAILHILAVLDGDGTVQALDSAGLDLLRRKVFIQDLLYESTIDRSVSGNLEHEKLELENKRLDELIDRIPSVKKAHQARQKLWRSVSEDLLERGVLDEKAAKNQAYVRHFVLDLAEKNRPTGFLRKKLSAPYRGYSKRRKGSKRDISTDYLEVETRALADIYADNAVEDAANRIAELANKRKLYAQKAKAENFENLVGGSEVVERIEELRSLIRESRENPDTEQKKLRKAWIEELTEIDPTYPYRKRIAMNMSRFKSLKYLGGDMDIQEDSALFKELSRAAKEQAKEPEGLAARGIFKAMAEKEKMIHQALGAGYVTPEKAALREGYTEWFYKRPNLFYRAQTVTQAQMAAFVENAADEAAKMLNIPVEKLHEALVLGRRKGWIIPDYLAKQLDDLPVNKRSGYIIRSSTKPFVQFWKRWILRYHPLRYNARNLVGDSERFWASGQEKALGEITRAVKMLIKKDEYYKIMKEYGVIGSSLWHEMNDVSKLKEFERFKDFSKPKNFKTATKRAFLGPLKLVSRTGSSIQDLTQFREDILRAAVFIYNYEQLQKGNKVRHWAGKIAEIEEIAKINKARAAAKISRETLGDYGKFTPFENDVLRQGIMPFYSWFKINTLFWPHVVLEASKAEGISGTGKRGIKVAAIAAPRVAVNLTRWLVRTLFVYAAMYWWNHRDEEAENKEASLPFWLRSMPHVNVNDYTLWGQTALSDFTEWLDMKRLAGVQWRRDAGFLDWKEAALEASRIIAESPVNKVYQTFNPFMKAPITAITGMETYPSVFRPRQVAPEASQKSLERAMLGIMGSDAKRFHQSLTGKRAFEDTLYAYFAGWFARPSDVDTFINDVKKTKEWTTLKRSSKSTGRWPGEAKKGKEEEYQEAKIRTEALKKRVLIEK